ncbi:hypothetical protein JCM14469_11060 [Desulfatiferula olefinivorans]
MDGLTRPVAMNYTVHDIKNVCLDSIHRPDTAAAVTARPPQENPTHENCRFGQYQSG